MGCSEACVGGRAWLVYFHPEAIHEMIEHYPGEKQDIMKGVRALATNKTKKAAKKKGK